jgi:predicted dehydrogenase
MIKIGLIGYGYWGPNLARNFNANENFELAAISDFSQDRRSAAGRLYPGAKLEADPKALLEDPALDAIAIATPVSTHFDLARQALENGKHVWLEKPMTDKVAQAEALIEVAEQKNLTLLVDHTFVYTGAVRKIKSIIDRGELGDLIYYDSTRVNLGLFQQDVDVIWDLAAHDLSILDYVIPFKKLAVSAAGSDYYGNHIVPKALLTIFMEQNVIGHINVSWLSPVKIRQTLVGGTAKMILYDDNNLAERIKVYDKGVDLSPSREELYRIKVQYRTGDMHAPAFDNPEALAVETSHFADCILNRKQPITGGKAGLEVVKTLVASKESLKLRGTPVPINF